MMFTKGQKLVVVYGTYHSEYSKLPKGSVVEVASYGSDGVVKVVYENEPYVLLPKELVPCGELAEALYCST